MTWEDKVAAMEQVAEILVVMQGDKLPESVDSFGSLTFPSDGSIISGQSPLLKGGPWKNHADVWLAKMREQLEWADKSPVVDGWKPNRVRERLEKFFAGTGLSNLLKDVDVNQKVLVHGDLSKWIFPCRL